MPVTLASLPAELHAGIASMCALQDERLRHAKYALHTATFAPLTDPNLCAKESWTTVGALSVVSKHWSKVTEPYRFSAKSWCILRDPFSRSYAGFPARDEDVAMYRRRALEPLLDRTREMIQEALQANDHAQLRRVAHALQPCELLRIKRNA
ncbi:hypothetical protein RHOSPDRAFT_26432 [Rhodotorula sp. JG-1b]|nr:hypothetical protein RHOSPDRAFT_26432 [Rhodotorula sp. JG-1b]